MASSHLEEEFREYDRLAAWPIVFQKLRNESLFEAEEFSLRAARHPLNRNLNRYRDVAPYDHSRVILQDGETDYINASVVEGCALATPAPTPGPNGDGARAKSPDLESPMEASQYRRYILTQGPLPSTAGHFWQMVWEQNSLAVVMLNKVIEKGAIKCTQYWPLGKDNDDHDTYFFEDTGYRVTLLEEEDEHYFTIRRLLLEQVVDGYQREVLHFHYTTWPDFGVPESPSAFLNFLLAVREAGALHQKVGPPVVHCSAGIGRSGTFCLVDSALVLTESKKTLDAVDAQGLLMHMRRFRMGLIQTFDQLRFSYLAIIHGGHRILDGRFTREDLIKDDFFVDDEDEDELSEEENDAAGEMMAVDELDEDDDDGIPDLPPPLPPARVESLSPASERKYLLQAAAAAAAAARPEDGSDDDESSTPSPLAPPLPKKQKMALDMNKMARPASSDTLSIDEGFVDVQTPVMDSDTAPTPTIGFGNEHQIRHRQTGSTLPLDEGPTAERLSVRKTIEQFADRQTSKWKWLVLPPVLIISYMVYKYYYT